MQKELTCSEYIKLILRRGGRWRNKQIEQAILETYGVQFQSNTLAKYLSFFIKEGKVESELVSLVSGKRFDEYWWIENAVPKQVKVIMYDEDPFVKIERWLDIARGYPADHPQVAAIMRQIEKFEKANRRVA